MAIVERPLATERTGSSDVPGAVAGPIELGGAGAEEDDRPGASRTDVDAAVSTVLVELGLVGWAVPAVVMGVPGLLVVVVVLLQLAGAGAWVPIGRRWLSRLDRRPSPAPSEARASHHRGSLGAEGTENSRHARSSTGRRRP